MTVTVATSACWIAAVIWLLVVAGVISPAASIRLTSTPPPVGAAIAAGQFEDLMVHLEKGFLRVASSMTRNGLELPRSQGGFNASAWRWDQYHMYNASTSFLKWMQSQYPGVVKLKVIGKSVQGRDIHAVHITAPHISDSVYKPIFKWLGGMHGDEVSSIEIMLRWAYYLASQYGKASRVTGLLQTVHVQILPCLNVDGREHDTRVNHHDKDLNRNFPLDSFGFVMDALTPNASWPLEEWYTVGKGAPEPETIAAMHWFQQDSPVFLSANVHGGSLVAVSPLDFCDPTDWVYHTQKELHLTLELHQEKREPEANLPQLWDLNLLPLMRLTEMVHLGAMLWVQDAATSTFLEASVAVVAPSGSSNATTFTDQLGRTAYFKMLSPGLSYCFDVQPYNKAVQYRPVRVAAKLTLPRQQVLQGRGAVGLRLEKIITAVRGSTDEAPEVVTLGAVDAAVCG